MPNDNKENLSRPPFSPDPKDLDENGVLQVETKMAEESATDKNIPAIIQQEFLKLGYSKEQIANLKPEEAKKILETRSLLEETAKKMKLPEDDVIYKIPEEKTTPEKEKLDVVLDQETDLSEIPTETKKEKESESETVDEKKSEAEIALEEALDTEGIFQKLRLRDIEHRYGKHKFGRFRAFLAGEFDYGPEDEGLLDKLKLALSGEYKPSKKELRELKLKSRGLLARKAFVTLFNRRTILGAAAMTAVGVMTGGAALPILFGIGGGILGNMIGEIWQSRSHGKTPEKTRRELYEIYRSYAANGPQILKELKKSGKINSSKDMMTNLETIVNNFYNNEVSGNQNLEQIYNLHQQIYKEEGSWNRKKAILFAIGSVAGGLAGNYLQSLQLDKFMWRDYDGDGIYHWVTRVGDNYYYQLDTGRMIYDGQVWTVLDLPQGTANFTRLIIPGLSGQWHSLGGIPIETSRSFLGAILLNPWVPGSALAASTLAGIASVEPFGFRLEKISLPITTTEEEKKPKKEAERLVLNYQRIQAPENEPELSPAWTIGNFYLIPYKENGGIEYKYIQVSALPDIGGKRYLYAYAYEPNGKGGYTLIKENGQPKQFQLPLTEANELTRIIIPSRRGRISAENVYKTKEQLAQTVGIIPNKTAEKKAKSQLTEEEENELAAFETYNWEEETNLNILEEDYNNLNDYLNRLKPEEEEAIERTQNILERIRQRIEVLKSASMKLTEQEKTERIKKLTEDLEELARERVRTEKFNPQDLPEIETRIAKAQEELENLLEQKSTTPITPSAELTPEQQEEVPTATAEKKEKKKYFKTGNLYYLAKDKIYFLITNTRPLDGVVYLRRDGDWVRDRIVSDNEINYQNRINYLNNNLNNNELTFLNRERQNNLFKNNPNLAELIKTDQENLITSRKTPTAKQIETPKIAPEETAPDLEEKLAPEKKIEMSTASPEMTFREFVKTILPPHEPLGRFRINPDGTEETIDEQTAIKTNPNDHNNWLKYKGMDYVPGQTMQMATDIIFRGKPRKIYKTRVYLGRDENNFPVFEENE